MAEKVWVGIFRNNRLDRILLLPNDKEFYEGIVDTLYDEGAIPIDFQNFGEFRSDALLLEEGYYIDLEKITKDHFLDMFAEKILEDRCLSLDNPVISFGRSGKVEIDETKETPKFLMIESEDAIIFLPIKTRGIIRKKRLMEFGFFKKLSTGNQNVVHDINMGVPFPTTVCAIFNKLSQRLCVINNDDFESIIGTFERKKKKAIQNLELFESGELTVGVEEYRVTFCNLSNIKNEVLESKRLTTRLGIYDSKKSFPIKKIKQAMWKLPEELRIKFDDKGKFIEVNSINKKTFIGILHNSIVERVLSGEVEVL